MWGTMRKHQWVLGGKVAWGRESLETSAGQALDRFKKDRGQDKKKVWKLGDVTSPEKDEDKVSALPPALQPPRVLVIITWAGGYKGSDKMLLLKTFPFQLLLILQP